MDSYHCFAKPIDRRALALSVDDTLQHLAIQGQVRARSAIAEDVEAWQDREHVGTGRCNRDRDHIARMTPVVERTSMSRS